MVNKFIAIFGRKKLIIFGTMLMGTSFIVFGWLSNIKNKNLYIALALLNRFFEGIASSLIQTTMYSISTNFFPNHKEAMIGYLEAVTGVGLIMGPLIGSALFAIGGYLFIFYAFGTIFIVFSFFISSIISDEIDGTVLSTGSNENTDSI